MIVSSDKFGAIRYEGLEINPHKESLSGITAYYIEPITARYLEKHISENDSSYLSGKGALPSFTFYSNKGKFRVIHASVWTNAKSENDAIDDIRHFQNAIKEEGWKWSDTAGSLAGKICRNMTELTQLEPRWREISHNAIHQGPMVCAMGGSKNVVAWDREKAFLRALYAPMPIGGWIAVNRSRLSAARGMKGFCRATLSVSSESYIGRIPPLPVRLNGHTIYPTGKVRGTWTLDMLFDALDNGGYSVVEIHEIAVSRTMPIHAIAADRISKVNDSRLKKMLYTRYWGRLAALGGYEGYKDARYDAPKSLLGSSLKWYYMGKSPIGFDCNPDYRPDHAAFIASDNHLVMNKALRRYGKNEVLSTHVDCIWTNNREIEPYESFREKHSGYARFYGIGCYNVGGNMAAQGYDKELTEESLSIWGTGLSSGDKVYRNWITGKPAETELATSNPPEHSEEIAAYNPIRNTPDIYWSGWTSKGWVLKGSEVFDTTKNQRKDNGTTE